MNHWPDFRHSEFYLLLIEWYNQWLQPKIIQCLLVHGNSAAKVFMKLIFHSTKGWLTPFILVFVCQPTFQQPLQERLIPPGFPQSLWEQYALTNHSACAFLLSTIVLICMAVLQPVLCILCMINRIGNPNMSGVIGCAAIQSRGNFNYQGLA